MKVIPAVDIMSGQVVRLYKGNSRQKTVYHDDPVAIARRWEEQGADMLHLVDLDATLGIGSNFRLIKEVIKSVSIPVEVAGGLRSESAAKDAADIASRIVIGTMAFKNRQLFEKISSRLGQQKIVVSVDHMEGQIMTHGWQSSTGIHLLDAVREFASMGFTEFLLTDVDRDGTMQGPDLEFLEKTCSVRNVNVISSGGISSLDDIREIAKRDVFGVILGKALYEDKISIPEVKKIT